MAGRGVARAALLAALALRACAAPAPTRTLLVSPVRSPRTASGIEESARRWLEAAGATSTQLRVSHLHAVHIAIVAGIPTAHADGLLPQLRAAFGVSEEGKPRSFEWDGEVGIAAGGVAAGGGGAAEPLLLM